VTAADFDAPALPFGVPESFLDPLSSDEGNEPSVILSMGMIAKVVN
jgi:hypothetical protein